MGIIQSALANERNVKPHSLVFKVSDKYETNYKSQKHESLPVVTGSSLAPWLPSFSPAIRPLFLWAWEPRLAAQMIFWHMWLYFSLMSYHKFANHTFVSSLFAGIKVFSHSTRYWYRVGCIVDTMVTKYNVLCITNYKRGTFFGG